LKIVILFLRNSIITPLDNYQNSVILLVKEKHKMKNISGADLLTYIFGVIAIAVMFHMLITHVGGGWAWNL